MANKKSKLMDSSSENESSGDEQKSRLASTVVPTAPAP